MPGTVRVQTMEDCFEQGQGNILLYMFTIHIMSRNNQSCQQWSGDGLSCKCKVPQCYYCFSTYLLRLSHTGRLLCYMYCGKFILLPVNYVFDRIQNFNLQLQQLPNEV